MKEKLAALLSLTLTFAPSASFAEMPAFAQVQEECSEWGFAGAMANCYLDKDKALGAELTVTYNHLKQCYDRERAEELVKSQKSWLAYQETTCRLREKGIEYEGRSIAIRAYAGCLVETTIARASELRALLNQIDGVGCPR